MKAKSKKEKYDKIMEKKMTTTVKHICEGLPAQFGEMMMYVRNLDFTERPDYAHIRALIE
jgi:hypothetical protein